MQAGAVGSLRRLRGGGVANARGAAAGEAEHDDSRAARTGERCDLCGTSLGPDHRHMLELSERRIDCTCESCWALRSGDDACRPVGTRVRWLEQLVITDERWASFDIPIGLAFFMRSSVADGAVIALYPSPAGATESEVDAAAWRALCAENPVLDELEVDIEGLVVNRLADTPAHAIAPIDDCYRLVGTVKASWEGISGGTGLERALDGFFDELRERGQA